MSIFDSDSKLTIFLNTLGDLIVLNILALICMLPVFTAGASITALYACTMRIVRGEDEKIIKGFFSSFRECFKKSTLMWLAGGALIAFLLFDIRLMQTIQGTFGLGYRVVLFVLVILLAMILMHAFALTARFDNTIKNTLKNAVIIAGSHFPQAVLMAFVTICPVLLLWISLRFVSVDFLIGLSGPAWLVSVYFVSLFKGFEEAEEV